MWELQTDMKIENSYKNCKLIWKFAKVHVGTIHQNMRIAKLIWKLQTDMKIAIWYENCKAILVFWYIVPTLKFAIFIWDTAGMKTCSGTERMFRFDCGVDDKNSTKQSLAKPSRIHILIPIPMLTQYDSYFKPWFLCSPRDVSNHDVMCTSREDEPRSSHQTWVVTKWVLFVI